MSTVAAKDHNTVLLRFAATGNALGIKFALEYGADLHATDGRGQTAVQLAEQNGHTKVVQWLLEMRAPRTA
ncbi:ankyrin repeat domain-containing protein [Burkholderia gladioli]|uniref:ankyrin repeat domain-containing protein n=1 Tax=Burkholderia gladioli TaxID=28095 RepID=UPI001641A838|nr:ankyrin repeat domain-containing protein [Burkholderia gladioli]MBJ9659096.1 ankyrin repeat domain-containing protein [Burkholderia gladioli]